MNLVHYKIDEFQFDDREYDQSIEYKPDGLWVSCEDGDNNEDWVYWSIRNNYFIGRYAYDIKLTDDANILHISTHDEMLAFNEKYKSFYLNKIYFNHVKKRESKFKLLTQIDWVAVSNQYDGIVISPYFWGFRLNDDFMWYYGWDCASGCVWNLDCIESIKENSEALERYNTKLEEYQHELSRI